MKTLPILTSAAALALLARVASGTENDPQQRDGTSAAGDHAHHQHHSMPPPQAADEHAHHRQQGQEHDHSSHGSGHAQAQHRSFQADEPTESERAHIPPDLPQKPMGHVSKERMVELMQMEDDAPFGMLLLDRFEWRDMDDADVQAWELNAWYGNDYDKLWLETEGESAEAEKEGRVELAWDRIIARWWSLQSGVRHDFGEGPSRNWLDLGIRGLAPYFFEIDASIYVGEQGRTAARFSGEYDMLITQRLILQPELEVNWYGKNDLENGIGSGLSDLELGIRLRYEVMREFAPYIGVLWERKFGRTADLARHHGEDDSDLVLVAGLRAWF